MRYYGGDRCVCTVTALASGSELCAICHIQIKGVVVSQLGPAKQSLSLPPCGPTVCAFLLVGALG